MRRMAWMVLSAALGMGWAMPAEAGWREFWDRVSLDWHRNNAWPEPFEHADRQAQAAPWTIMLNNGWRLQNTLGAELFEPDTSELTHAGRLKLKAILTTAPVHRRTVYVLRGETADVTARRVEAVQTALQNLHPENQPQVLLTDIGPRPASGDYYDRVNRELEKTTPSPRLPPRQERPDGI